MELRNRNIITCFEMTHLFLIDASLPTSHWLNVVYVVAFTSNRLSTPILKDKSPYEALFVKVPGYGFLKLLGVLAFPILLPLLKLI